MTTKQEIAHEMLRIYDGKPERWCQGALARCSAGKPCDPVDRTAVCWCLTGARRLAKNALGASCDDVYGFALAIECIVNEYPPEWNDADERAFDDVVKLLTEIAEGQ
jgi:hypothetical protein